MFSLVTGLPGSGKTLFTLSMVERLRVESHRPVFYFGVDDLTLPWERLESAEDWHKCPDGSIVVIDECQRLFRPRPVGAKVPDYVEAIETHRHRGLDVFALTQHPMLLDTNVRRLSGKHYHVARQFGLPRAKVFELESCRLDPLKSVDQPGVMSREFIYPRESFGWYKSAEVHTHKVSIPKRVWFMLSVPFIAGALLWFAWGQITHLMHHSAPVPAVAVRSSPSAGGARFVSSSEHSASHVTTQEYVKLRVPRIVGLPATAPIFDEVTKPTRAPVPVACVSMGKRCQCYSQQGTAMDVLPDMCRKIVARGFFRTWDDKPAPGSSRKPRVASARDSGRRPVASGYRAVWKPAEAPVVAPAGHVSQ